MDIQLRLLLLAIVCLPACVRVTAEESTPAGVRACFEVADASRRLACYDDEVGKMVTGGHVTARVASVGHRPDGHVTLRLLNDQVWEQADDGPDLKIAAGDQVTIDKGALGSYWLSAHSRVAIRVRRTQ